ATSQGCAKIPAPTMPPITIIVASNNPSCRRGFEGSTVVIPTAAENLVGRLCQTPPQVFHRTHYKCLSQFGRYETPEKQQRRHVSPRNRTQFVDFELWSHLYQHRAIAEMLREFRIVI